jgi:hypothetical protein
LLLVVVCCVGLCLLCGVAFLLDDNGNPSVCLCPADDGLWCLPDGTLCAPCVAVVPGPLTRASVWTGAAGIVNLALLAAVPGGLCLLL